MLKLAQLPLFFHMWAVWVCVLAHNIRGKQMVDLALCCWR